MDSTSCPAEQIILDAYLAEAPTLHYWFDNNEIQFLLSILNKLSVFVDVGAHVGTYTASIAPHIKLVHAFEPGAWPYSALLHILRTLKINNVMTYQMGLGNQAEFQTYKETKISTQGSYGTPLSSVIGWYPSMTFTLDMLVEMGIIERCDVIKIDTNGSEPLVIQGGKQFFDQFRPVVLCKMDFKKEYGFGCKPTDVLDLLPDYEWRVWDADGRLVPLMGKMHLKPHFNVLGMPPGREKI